MTRPTPRAAAFFALSVPLALLLAACWPAYWYFSLYLPGAALSLMLADFTMLLPPRRLQAEPAAPKRLYIGQPGMVDLRLRSGGRTRTVGVAALLELEGEAEEPAGAEAVLRDGAADCRLRFVPLRRGRLTVAAVWLRWRGPLGLVEARSRVPVGAAVDIVPNVKGIHEAAVRFFSEDAIHGLKSQRARGEGAEFDKLCDFAAGMDNRFIDWKRSARHRKLLAKEFRQERNHPVVLGFDTGHLMLEPVDGVPKLDHAIHAGLLLGWISLHEGDLVGGCGFDARFRNFVQPGRGMPHFTQLQRFAAALEYRTEETNFTLGLAELNSRLKRRTLVILFSEFVDAISAELLVENLQLMTRRHLVVFVTMRDPFLARLRDAPPDRFSDAAEAVIADDFLRERSIVLERVARLGVHCLDVPAGGLSTALLNRYLLIKQRGLL